MSSCGIFVDVGDGKANEKSGIYPHTVSKTASEIYQRNTQTLKMQCPLAENVLLQVVYRGFKNLVKSSEERSFEQLRIFAE